MCWKWNNNNQDKVVVAEFNISLYCDECEKLVAETISKIKGVEKFMTDMTRHQVVVMGKMNPAKVLKKLKNTGKRVELILLSEYDDVDQADIETEDFWQPATNPSSMYGYLGESTELYTMFSDENPNACSIM